MKTLPLLLSALLGLALSIPTVEARDSGDRERKVRSSQGQKHSNARQHRTKPAHRANQREQRHVHRADRDDRPIRSAETTPLEMNAVQTRTNTTVDTVRLIIGTIAMMMAEQ